MQNKTNVFKEELAEMAKDSKEKKMDKELKGKIGKNARMALESILKNGEER